MFVALSKVPFSPDFLTALSRSHYVFVTSMQKPATLFLQGITITWYQD
jgi:hypothetical protein